MFGAHVQHPRALLLVIPSAQHAVESLAAMLHVCLQVFGFRVLDIAVWTIESIAIKGGDGRLNAGDRFDEWHGVVIRRRLMMVAGSWRRPRHNDQFGGDLWNTSQKGNRTSGVSRRGGIIGRRCVIYGGIWRGTREPCKKLTNSIDDVLHICGKKNYVYWFSIRWLVNPIYMEYCSKYKCVFSVRWFKYTCH